MWTSKAYPIYILLLFALVIFPACSQSDDVAQGPTIAGKWLGPKGTISEYREDGIFVSPKGWSGSWEIQGDSLKIIRTPRSISIFEIMEMSDDSLVIRQLTNNKEFILERVE